MNFSRALMSKCLEPRNLALIASLALTSFATFADQPSNVEISSLNGGEINFEKGYAIFQGGVVVDQPGVLRLTCEYLLTDVPSSDRPLQQITATTNVTFELTQPPGTNSTTPIVIHGRAEKLVYSKTNELITLYGSPSIDMPQGSLSSDQSILYDLKTRNIRTEGRFKTTLRPESIRQRKPTDSK